MIAITVEDKDDIEKFKDYKPEASGGEAPQTPPAESAPAKEEVVEKSPSPPEPKPAKPSTAPPTDRVFASPLARKLAEDNNVSDLIYSKSTTINLILVRTHCILMFVYVNGLI